MLFIHPDYRGQGIGKQLLDYAFEHFNVNKVDVNEANTQALGFYEKWVCNHLPFRTGWQREPYPLLHMNLENA